jgi:hypothetical protein
MDAGLRRIRGDGLLRTGAGGGGGGDGGNGARSYKAKARAHQGQEPLRTQTMVRLHVYGSLLLMATRRAAAGVEFRLLRLVLDEGRKCYILYIAVR